MSKKSPILKADIVQEHPEDAPPGWADVQEKLAASSGLSILLIDGRQPPALLASNNNSICHALQSSSEYVGLCDPYCGDAHRRAMSAGSVAKYKCHAGLLCFTMPVQIGGEHNLAAIGGRAFVTGADYRSLIERLRTGDLKDLLVKDPFANVVFAEERSLEQLADRLEEATQSFNGTTSKQPVIEQTISTETVKSSGTLESELEQVAGEVNYRSRIAESLQHFLERISPSDPAQVYISILTNCKELLQAERASLLVFDETSKQLVLKAAVGLSVGPSEVSLRLGEGISGGVLENGKPLVVQSIDGTEFEPAPPEWNYKTKSFISYPIAINGRRIGVFNVADKWGGGTYNDVDLNLLEIIGPQVAVALESAERQQRATEYQMMSITDPLTSLPNRRYLEERLTEELNRSKRYDYPMSFLMIDIDDFKSYNDLNGHQAGDQALQITGHCLKATLRSADVAARYGGEEFCILLPQTPAQEAKVIADRIRQNVASTTYPHGKRQPFGAVTISIGLSTFAKHIDTAESIIAAADHALYAAKGQGKNRIEVYQHDLVSAAENNEWT